MPLVKPGELNDCPVYEAEDSLSQYGAEQARTLPLNSVLVSCIGNLAKTGINRVLVASNQQINATIFYEGIIPEFGLYYLQLSTVADWMYGKASATTITILNKSKFEELPFLIAPLREQRRIVAAIEEQFTRLDAGVAALERARKGLKRYRASVLKAAVEGRLTEQWREENPDAESGSALLERILEERRAKWEEAQLARYAAKEQNPPKNWRSKYKEPAAPDTAGLPELPEGWVYVPTQPLLPPSKDGMKTGPFGSLLKKHEHQTQGIPVLGIENIGRMRFIPGSKIHVTAEKAN